MSRGAETELEPVVGSEGSVVDLGSHLEALLSSGELVLGQRLPSERQLAQTLGCSRHHLRRQLDQLERENRITRSVGRGTFLRLAPQPRTDRAVPSSPATILEARMAWEPPLMSLVAMQATADDLADVEAWLRKGEEAIGKASIEHADLGFHRALAAAAHNEVVTTLHELLEESRHSLTWGQLGLTIYTADNWASCQQEHGAIAAALQDRNAELAASRMRSHLLNVRRQFLGDL